MESAQTKTDLGAVSSSLYVSFQVIANILSVKIALLPYFHLAVDGGTLIYPLTFTLRDFVHKTLGKRSARKIVILAGLINAVMALLLVLVGKMQPDPGWAYQNSFEQVLLPVWRITIASIIAQIISELADTEVFSLVYKKFSDILGVLLSNFAGLIIDSVVFSVIAFLGALPGSTVLQIIVANILIKLVMSIISAPSIKLVPRTAAFEEI